jgi:hypothetical protein
MRLDKSHIDQVEHGIAPPMGLSITLPVDGTRFPSMRVYVAVGPFDPNLKDAKFSDVLEQLKSIAANLTL